MTKSAWFDRSCSAKKAFACEVPVNLAVAAHAGDFGCSDRSVEAHFEEPNVVGCAVNKWTGDRDLRAAPTGVACGNSIEGECAALADACDVDNGWTICERASQLGMVRPEECDLLQGKSHTSLTQVSHLSHTPLFPICRNPVDPIDRRHGVYNCTCRYVCDRHVAHDG